MIHIPEIRISLELPPHVAMVASAYYKAGAGDPTVSWAVYPIGLDAGETDERLTGQSVYEDCVIRQFSGTGCTVSIKDFLIEHADKGLQGFRGHRVHRIDTPHQPGRMTLIAWKSEDGDITNPEITKLIHFVEAAADVF